MLLKKLFPRVLFLLLGLVVNAANAQCTNTVVSVDTDQVVVSTDSAMMYRIVRELSEFYAWSDGLPLLISETGVPTSGHDANCYAEIMGYYLQVTDALGMSVIGWAVGDMWGEYPLRISPETEVFALLANARVAGGISLAGGEFGMGGDDARIGEHNRAYLYHIDSSIWRSLSKAGIEIVRYPLRLERLFHITGEVKKENKALLLQAFASARSAGVEILLDPHNYTQFFDGEVFHTLGGELFTKDIYLTMIREMAMLAHENDDVVMGIGLMNEPYAFHNDMESKKTGSGIPAWERVTQEALDLVRSTGFTGMIEVPLGNWQGLHDLAWMHQSGPWINDPLGNFWYGGHQYFNQSHTGFFEKSFVENEQLILQDGFQPREIRITFHTASVKK